MPRHFTLHGAEPESSSELDENEHNADSTESWRAVQVRPSRCTPLFSNGWRRFAR
jgi:hypothetical protein